MTDDLKKAAAEKALELVQDGMLLGLGSGSTAKYFTEGVGRLVKILQETAGIGLNGAILISPALEIAMV